MIKTYCDLCKDELNHRNEYKGGDNIFFLFDKEFFGIENICRLCADEMKKVKDECFVNTKQRYLEKINKLKKMKRCAFCGRLISNDTEPFQHSSLCDLEIYFCSKKCIYDFFEEKGLKVI